MKKIRSIFMTLLVLITAFSVSMVITACDNGGENYTLAIDPATVSVQAGSTVTLKTNAPEGTDVKWKSEDENIATVNGGVVTGVNAGTVTITAQAGQQTAECSVTVTPADTQPSEPVISIGISANALTVTVGDEPTLITATVYIDGEKTDSKSVSWSSGDNTVLSVSADEENSLKAYITAIKAGKTTVTASCEGKTVSCEVTVLAAPVNATGKVNLITATGVSPEEVVLSIAGDDIYDATPDESGNFDVVLPPGEYTLTASYGSVKQSVTANIDADNTAFPALDLNATVGGYADTGNLTWASAPESSSVAYTNGDSVTVNSAYSVAWISGTGADTSFKTSAVIKAAQVGEADPSIGFIFAGDDGVMYYVCVLKARIRIYSLTRNGMTDSEVPGSGAVSVTTHSNRGMEIVASNVFEGAVPADFYNSTEGEYGAEYIFTVVKDGADYYFYLDPYTDGMNEATSMFFMLEEGKTIHTISANKSHNITDIKMLENKMQLPVGKTAVGVTVTNEKITGAFTSVSYTADTDAVVQKTGNKAVVNCDEHVDVLFSGDVAEIQSGDNAGVYTSVGGYIFLQPVLDEGYALSTLTVTYGDGTKANVLPYGDKFFFYNINNEQYTVTATSVLKSSSVAVSGTVNVAEVYKYNETDNTGSDPEFYKYWIGYVARGYVPALGAIGYNEVGVRFTDADGNVYYGTVNKDFTYNAYLPEGTYDAEFFDFDHYSKYVLASKFKLGSGIVTFEKINRLQPDSQTEIAVSGETVTVDGNLDKVSFQSRYEHNASRPLLPFGNTQTVSYDEANDLYVSTSNIYLGIGNPVMMFGGKVMTGRAFTWDYHMDLQAAGLSANPQVHVALELDTNNGILRLQELYNVESVTVRTKSNTEERTINGKSDGSKFTAVVLESGLMPVEGGFELKAVRNNNFITVIINGEVYAEITVGVVNVRVSSVVTTEQVDLFDGGWAPIHICPRGTMGVEGGIKGLFTTTNTALINTAITEAVPLS